MIIPDINLLLYAYDAGSPFHPRAADWWTACLSGSDPVGLPDVVTLGFVRVATNARAFAQPMQAAEAAAHVRSWIDQPSVQRLVPGPNHLQVVLELLEGLGTAGNLVGDAQLAAMAMDHDAVLHTADTDFARFAGLRWSNPLTPVPGPAQRRPRTR